MILSMSILGLLSYMMARNDLSLSERSAEVMAEVYDLNARAERSFAKLDGISVAAQNETDSRQEYMDRLAKDLPDGMTLSGETVEWTETEGDRTLNCAAALPEETSDGHITWLTHRLSIEMEMAMPWS